MPVMRESRFVNACTCTIIVTETLGCVTMHGGVSIYNAHTEVDA